MSLNVRLLSHTPSPDVVIAGAARLCYSQSHAVLAVDEVHREEKKMQAFVQRLRRSGHMSPFEHATFTFAVDGLSRVTSHQLVRHRIASFSQQSQRYVSQSEVDIVCPPCVRDNPEASRLFRQISEDAHNAYRRLQELGIPKEDARYLLPHGWQTHLIMTMNARELHHFFSLRLCRRAQWEIRMLAGRMLRRVREVAPLCFEVAGPSCVVEGQCNEQQPCEKPFRSTEELLDETDH
ncbi:MAG: FAD-dependent thymidylate synthase [Synergistales bacterium]|nr:FAD-dependent thymidylate synthase [Synergistales bacterium]